MFDKFPKHHMKILLGDFKAKQQTIGNENLQDISNDNGVRVVKFASSKNLSQKYNVPIT
jgi:hypothetical protein